MINIEYKSKRSNLYELQVRTIIGSLPFYSEEVEGAARVFERSIEKLQRRSVAFPADCYKLEMAEDYKSFTIWHRKANGDKDRVVAVVSNK